MAMAKESKEMNVKGISISKVHSCVSVVICDRLWYITLEKIC